MYLAFTQVASSGAVKTVADLGTIPGNATHAELQSDTQDIRYTMDGETNPTSTSGMLLVTTHEPKTFLIDDVRNIRFTQGAGGAGKLNIHYFGGYAS